jgi:serine protease Do
MNRRKLLIAIAAALAITVAPALLFARGRSEATSGQSAEGTGGESAALTSTQLSDASKNLETIQYSFREVAKSVLPVVVELDVQEQVTRATPQNPFEFFFQIPNQKGQGQQRQYTQPALGSGIIVRHAANHYYVLTNNHVAGSATQITVQLNDGRRFKAKLVGADTRRDLAMVSFDSNDNLPVAELGDSGELQVGDLVLAVGNPLGFSSTLTMGIVSALGRQSPSTDIASYNDYIQTDASINEGNSGGALVNIKGQVVGINTWIAGSYSGGSVGLGFAIPINSAKSAIDAFISTGKVQYGWLGVSIQSLTNNDLFEGMSGDLKLSSTKGAIVLNVFKGSPAEKAGLLPGDFITRAAGQSVTDHNQLTQIVGGLIAGKSYDFELYRNGAKQTVSVTIAQRDPNDNVAQYKNLWPGIVAINITDYSKTLAEQNNTPIADNASGVVVADTIDSSTPASIAGIKVGDVITAINGNAIRNIADFYKALNDKSKRDVTFKINRQGTEITIGLTK